MNVHFVSLGCPKNRVDTEVMLGHTADAGHSLVAAPEAAEVIVVNTCGFIGEAKQESIDAILEMARHKQAGTCKRLVVAGCLSQRYPKELATEMPEVDQFIGTDEVGRDREGDRRDDRAPRASPTRRAYLYDDAAPRRRSQAAAQRLREDRRGLRSPVRVLHHPQAARPAAQPRAGVGGARGARRWSPAARKEICLIAQDLTTYGTDLPGAQASRGAPRLASLLRELGARRGARAGSACTTPTRPPAPTSCST